MFVCLGIRKDIQPPECEPTQPYRLPRVYQLENLPSNNDHVFWLINIFLSLAKSKERRLCQLGDRNGIQPVKRTKCWSADGDLTGDLHVIRVLGGTFL